MGLDNCKRCGKLYLMERTAYCDSCQSEEDAVYRLVREFIKQNPNSTLLDVHVQTGVPLAKLLEMQKNAYFFGDS